MPRTYVDNAMNRSLGRVGMAHGTAVHSSSSYSNYSSSSSSTRVYVDNAMNRSLGRVGMEHGTAVHSRSSPSSYSSSSSSSPSVYVDNAMNRSLGRVGMEHGTAVHSKSSQISYTSPSTYVDNALNRRLGRVGLERGSAVYSKSESSVTSTQKVYVDNAYNRRLGRVGEPVGSAVVSKSSSSVLNVESPAPKLYVDNALNRRLGRVGKPLGSMPVSKIKCNPNMFDFNNDACLYQNKCTDEFYETLPDNVLEEVLNLQNLMRSRFDSKKNTSTIALKAEMIIPFDELELGDKIGGGGFGDVHTAFWKGQQVAVKKLRVQRVTQHRKKQFEDEVRSIASLIHPNIVKFYGACIVTPNLAMVMEFLPDGSLYDNLYYSEVQQFDDKIKNQLICDSFSALKYIHAKEMVHRDIKSKNIMLFDNKTRCKLADFGLALKDDAETNASTKDFAFAGTEKYCPKEVIDGKRLTFDELKAVDVYSLAITSVELLTEKEPFDDCSNIHQIRKAIQGGETPKMDGISIDMKRLLQTALSTNASSRPSAADFLASFEMCTAY